MHRRARFLWLVAVVSLVSVGLALGGAPQGASAGQPITISILDNGGDYASTGVIIENYKKANPDKVKEIKLQRGPAPGRAGPRAGPGLSGHGAWRRPGRRRRTGRR